MISSMEIVGIIVNAIIWDFNGVGPDIVVEIDVVVIDPRVITATTTSSERR